MLNEHLWDSENADVLIIYPSKYIQCGTWNPIFEVPNFSGLAEMFHSVSRRFFFLFELKWTISVLIRASAKKCHTSLRGVCEKIPLNPFYFLCYLKTICPHSPMSPAGPFLPLLPRIESGGARHRLFKKKSHLARGRGGVRLGLGGVMLGNQNDRQQWKVFCGLPHICEVAWLVRFHSSLWSLQVNTDLATVYLFLLGFVVQ